MDPAYPDALPAQTRLHWYVIERVLGQGGFGITYLARDSNLDQRVAIKEYLPVEFATRTADFTIRSRTDALRERYRWGLERFLQEARTLARFEHPNIVRVLSVFEFNNTAYMVMRFEEGASLAAVLDRRGTLPEAELTGVVLPILDGLELIHAAGFIHRDIKPDNIYIRGNGQPVLLDFGSARQAAGSSDTLTILVAPGYAPFEQYYSDSGNQGPWTDIYALAATCYRAIAGRAPLDAVARSKGVLGSTQESMTPASIVGAGRYSAQFLAAIDHALAFAERDRPQSIAEWRRELAGEQPAPLARAAVPASPFVEASRTERAVTRLATAPPAAVTRVASAPPPGVEPPAQARGWFGRPSTLAVAALVAGLAVVIAVGAYWLAGWRKDATAEISALRQELLKNRDRVTAQATEQPARQAEPPAAVKEPPAAAKEPPSPDAAAKQTPKDAPAQEARPKPAPVAAPPAAKPPPKDKETVAAKAERRPIPAAVPASAPASAALKPDPTPSVVAAPPASPPPQPAPKPEPDAVQMAVTPPKPVPKPPEPDPLAEARRDYDAGRHEDAVRKARPLAEKGNPGAQHLLGDAHASGRGAARSIEEAARWFERAALQGNVDAMQWLGGHFAAQDNRYMAFVWYGCAAKLGAAQAQRARDQLAGSLQPYDQVNAERAIAACVAKGKAR